MMSSDESFPSSRPSGEKVRMRGWSFDIRLKLLTPALSSLSEEREKKEPLFTLLQSKTSIGVLP
jgi:hypothetical protein